MLLSLLQGLLDGFVVFGQGLLHLLPSSPFQSVYGLAIDNQLLNSLAWIIPIPQILSVLQAWVVSVGAFYVYSVALRWIKAIE